MGAPRAFVFQRLGNEEWEYLMVFPLRTPETALYFVIASVCRSVFRMNPWHLDWYHDRSNRTCLPLYCSPLEGKNLLCVQWDWCFRDVRIC